MEEINLYKPYEDLLQIPTRDVYLRCKALNSMPILQKVNLKDGRDGEIMRLPEGFEPRYPTIRSAWVSQASRELQRTPTGVLLTDEFVERTVLTIQKNPNNNSYSAIITLVGMHNNINDVASTESSVTSMQTSSEGSTPQFKVVMQMPTRDVYLRGVALNSMPALEKKKLKDGSDGVIMWLPEGFEPKYPTVRFAWLSPLSQELQRTSTGVRPTDEFVNRTVLSIQKNLINGSYGATITVVSIQRTSCAVAADIAAWQNLDNGT